jgi:hypothetical protein
VMCMLVRMRPEVNLHMRPSIRCLRDRDRTRTACRHRLPACRALQLKAGSRPYQGVM